VETKGEMNSCKERGESYRVGEFSFKNKPKSLEEEKTEERRGLVTRRS